RPARPDGVMVSPPLAAGLAPPPFAAEGVTPPRAPAAVPAAAPAAEPRVADGDRAGAEACADEAAGRSPTAWLWNGDRGDTLTAKTMPPAAATPAVAGGR